MLNEVIEFKEYNAKKRLKAEMTKNDFSGLKRAFEVLSINYLAEAKELGEVDCIEYTKTKLDEWFANKYTPYAHNVLCKKGKSKASLDNEVAAKNTAKYMDLLAKKRESYMEPVFDLSRKSDTRSNSNQLSYERAIANALSIRGFDGLKRFYLVCDDDLLNMDRITVSNLLRSKTNAPETLLDVISKITAAYLLKSKQQEDSSELVLSQTDIFNWIVKGNYKQYFINTSYYMKPEDSGKIQIFTKATIGNKQQNIVKYHCNKEWVKHFDVIEESELDTWRANNPNGHFYSDLGSSKPLSKDKKYRKI